MRLAHWLILIASSLALLLGVLVGFYAFGIRFATWPVLLALIVPFLLVGWTCLRDGRRVVLPFDHGRRGDGVGWRILLSGAEVLPGLLLAVVICILAGP